jgi:hypothetical protein
VLGNVVAELSQLDDLTNWRIRCGCNLYQIEPEALSFSQGIGQFQDTQLFAGGTQDDSDFAGANPTVYPKLVLQFNSISLPTRRECAVTPYFSLLAISGFHCRQFGRNTLALPQLRLTATAGLR